MVDAARAIAAEHADSTGRRAAERGAGARPLRRGPGRHHRSRRGAEPAGPRRVSGRGGARRRVARAPGPGRRAGNLAPFIESAARHRECGSHVVDSRRAATTRSRSSSPCIAVALTAGFAITRMRADIFPDLDLPVIYVAQPYGGMSPAQMEGYITYYYEYHFLYINGIESVESKSIQNTSLLKLTFHPGTDMSEALAQTIGYVNRARAFMPPGHGRSVHHAVRRRHGAGRLSRLPERHPQSRRDSGSRAEPRPAAVRDAARLDLAAAVWRQSAHDRDSRRSRSAAFVRHGARRSDPRGHDRQRHHAVGQRQHRRRNAHLADELRRRHDQRSARPADSHRRRAADRRFATSARSATAPTFPPRTRWSTAGAPSTSR